MAWGRGGKSEGKVPGNEVENLAQKSSDNWPFREQMVFVFTSPFPPDTVFDVDSSDCRTNVPKLHRVVLNSPGA